MARIVAVMLCLLVPAQAFRMGDKQVKGVKSHEQAKCCCKVGACNSDEHSWDEGMKNHHGENKCCKFRSEGCAESWTDWSAYNEEANEDMCEDSDDTCAQSWGGGAHFDTLYNNTACDGENCVAYELSTEDDKPTLSVHLGTVWAVKHEGGKLIWKPISVNTDASRGTFIINLLNIDSIKLQGDGRLVIYKNEGAKHYEVMSMKAGLYHDVQYVEDGAEKLDNYFKDGANNGDSLVQTESESGFVFSAMIVSGFYAAATASGVAVSNTALAGALGTAMLIPFFKLHEVEEEAVKKVWSMLKCHGDFKLCSQNVVVPDGKSCP